MKNRVRSKKGSSLIEVIVSVTILAIVIIPISNVVINAVKTNKMSERKQVASFQGQKLLEEFKSYDQISLDANEKFTLLKGLTLSIKDPTNPNVYSGEDTYSKGNDNYNLNVFMEKDINFENSSTTDNYVASFSLLSSDNKITYKSGKTGTPEILDFNSNKIIFEINSDATKIKLIEVNGVDETEIETWDVLKLSETNKILIYVGATFINQIDFEIRNLDINAKVGFDTIVQESVDEATRGDINTEPIGVNNGAAGTGVVEIHQSKQGLTGEIIGDLYKIKVEVKYKNDIYYTSSVAQNIQVIK